MDSRRAWEVSKLITRNVEIARRGSDGVTPAPKPAPAPSPAPRPAPAPAAKEAAYPAATELQPTPAPKETAKPAKDSGAGGSESMEFLVEHSWDQVISAGVELCSYCMSLYVAVGVCCGFWRFPCSRHLFE